MVMTRFGVGMGLGVVAALAVGVLPVVACSSDDKSASSSSSSGGTVGETVSVPITAAQGGTVADKAGSVSLVIPPGALEKDTTITLAVGASAADTIANVYDFGPDGLKFVKPVALEIKATVPSGKTAAIAYESSGTWKTVSGSTVDATKGTVKASTDHFTKYSVVIVNGQAVLTPPATCADAIAQFAACGGDPTGTWTYADFCIDPKTAKDPFNGKCPQGTATAEITDGRTLTIDATTISESAGQITTTLSYDIPDACLTANNATCAQVPGSDTALKCNQASPGASCLCTKQEVSQKQPSTQTYTVSGTTMTVTDPTDNSKTVGDYCVKGNLLYFKEQAGSGLLYVLNKK